MGYDIFIGEMVEERDDDGKPETVVHKTRHPEAPVFVGDEMTGDGNARHPGYGQWTEWTRAVGLHAMFFDKQTGLMREHPGCQPFTEHHLMQVRAAIGRWKQTHKLPAGWDDPPGKDAPQEEIDRYETEPCTQRDPMLARLVWLEWWMAYALANCKRPGLHNR